MRSWLAASLATKALLVFALPEFQLATYKITEIITNILRSDSCFVVIVKVSR
jgi:hypothetical protein